MSNSLMTVKYKDSSGSIFLETYADTIVYDDAIGKKKTLCAIRLRFASTPRIKLCLLKLMKNKIFVPFLQT